MKKIIIYSLGHNLYDDRVYYKYSISLVKNYNVALYSSSENNIETTNKNNIKLIGKSGNRFLNIFKGIFFGLKNKADIYVAHDIDSYLVVVGIKLLKWNAKIIFDSHEYYDLYSSDKLSKIEKILLTIFTKIIKPLTIRLFSGVTTVTEDMKDFYKPVKNKEVIYNFPLTNELNKISVDKNLNKKYKDNFLLIFQGGISYDRGIIEYLKIVNKLKNIYPNIKLLLIGPFTSSKLEKEVFNYIKNNNLSNHIEILGKLPLFEVYKYTKIAHIGLNFLKPSFNNDNGIQIKIFEYLYLETPIIGTNNNKNFINFIVDNNAGIAINYGNIEEGVKAVETIINNYDYYKNSCKKIKNNFTWDNEEKKLLKFYDLIINEK